MRSPKNESFSGDRISAHIKARASQPKTLSKYYGHPYSFRIFCGNRNFLRIQIRRALPITDRHALLRLPELRRKGRHAPLRQKTEKKETRNRCAILGGIFCRNTVRNVFLAAMCRYKNAQGNERFLIGGGAASIEGGGSAASIEGADAPYGRKVRQPLKGCALTKIGFANASIPSTFPAKKRTSHKRFVSTSGVRSENQRFPIWRNAFG